MAKESIGDMYVAIRGDVSTLKRDISNLQKQVQGDTKRIENSFVGTFKRIAKNTAAFLGITGALTLINRLMTTAVKKFREFDKEMANVNTIIGLSADKLNVMKTAIRGLSREIGGNAKDLAEGLYQATSAGVDAANAMKFMKVAAQAAKAGLSSTKVSVDGLTTVLNAWHMSAEDASKVADIMFETVKRGKTTFEELASSMSTVAGIAASSNIAFEQIAGGVATLTKQGVPTAQAMTQLRAAIIAMNQELGDGWTKTMTLAEGMEEMRRRTGYSNNVLKETVGRIEGVNGILGMTSKNAQMAAEDFQAMGDAGGSMMKAFAEQTQSLDFVMNRLGATFDDALLRTMRAMLPLFNGVQKAMQGLMDFILPVEDALENERIAMLSASSAAMQYEQGTEGRKKALQDLAKEYPELMKNLNAEKTTNEELATAVREVNKAYLNKIRQVAIEKELSEIAQRGIGLQSKLLASQKRIVDTYLQLSGAADTAGKSHQEMAKYIDEFRMKQDASRGSAVGAMSELVKYNAVLGQVSAYNKQAKEDTEFYNKALSDLGITIDQLRSKDTGGNKGDSGEDGPKVTVDPVIIPVKPEIDVDEQYKEDMKEKVILSAAEMEDEMTDSVEVAGQLYNDLGQAAVQGLVASGIGTIWGELTKNLRKEAGIMVRIALGMVDAIMAELTRLTALKILSAIPSGGFASWLGIGGKQHGGSVFGGAKEVKKFASGGSMDVPFGFQNDQYPVKVESGERLDVTTRGKASAQEAMLQNLNDRIEALNMNLISNRKGDDQKIAITVGGEIKGNDIRLAYDKNNNMMKRAR